MRNWRAVPFLLACTLALALPASGSAQFQINARGATITIGGRLQTQYTIPSVDTAVSQVFFRRARIQADIRVNDFLDGRLETDFAAGRAGLQDAFARLTFDEAFAVSFGQYKRAFSSFELHSANDLPIIERDGSVPPGSDGRCRGVGGICSFSRFTQQLQFDGRDLGVRAEGALGERVVYRVTVTNGQGSNASDVNDTKSTSGRIEVGVTDNVRLGAFGALHDYPDPIPVVDDSDYADALGADLEIGGFRGGLHLIAGGVTGNNWRLGPDVSFLAGQVMTTYYVEIGNEKAAGIEPMIRASWADPDTDTDDDGGLLLTPGLMLYFQGRNGLAANFDTYLPQNDADTEWSLKFQLFLYF